MKIYRQLQKKLLTRKWKLKRKMLMKQVQRSHKRLFLLLYAGEIELTAANKLLQRSGGKKRSPKGLLSSMLMVWNMKVVERIPNRTLPKFP